MTLLRSCVERLNLTNLLKLFCCLAFYDAKIVSLLLGNNKFNKECLELISFVKTLISDFLWQISSCSSLNWHCLHVKEALRAWLLTSKSQEKGLILMSLRRPWTSKWTEEKRLKSRWNMDLSIWLWLFFF